MNERAVIHDIAFAITDSGALVPYAEVMKDNGTVGYVRIANIATMLKNDIRVGDFVNLDGLSKITQTLKHLRPVDAHLVGVPMTCPCCEQELTFDCERTVVVRCDNDGCLKEDKDYAH